MQLVILSSSSSSRLARKELYRVRSLSSTVGLLRFWASYTKHLKITSSDSWLLSQTMKGCQALVFQANWSDSLLLILILFIAFSKVSPCFKWYVFSPIWRSCQCFQIYFKSAIIFFVIRAK